MTRGKIQYIEKDGMVYTTIEFNGDMYPSGHGDEIIEHFKTGGFKDRDDYEKYVARFDKRNFGYTNNIHGTIYMIGEYKDSDFEFNDYYSDYLYIVNGSGRDIALLSREDKKDVGQEVILPPDCMAIVCFYTVEEILHREDAEERKKGNYADAVAMEAILEKLSILTEKIDAIEKKVFSVEM